LANRGLSNYATLGLHRYFESVFAPLRDQRARLIEIGCAQSKWLPYFARHWGFYVAGLDTSDLGCERSRAMLGAAGVAGEIKCGDMFDPPLEMRERFDVVLSFGLIEHFPDTATAVAACASFAKPGGMILSLIPNMNGIPGFLQRLLDREVYDIHVPLDTPRLAAAHADAGLSVSRCEYLLSANLAVLNHPGLRPQLLNRAARAALIGGTGTVWALERMGFNIKPGQWLSPYLSCVAIKTA
jgi:SAM-dependent methyltransferase